MTGARWIARELERRGVRHAFEVVGGTITHLLDAMHLEGGVQIVSMRHEQAAAFAADACGRLGEAPGVALATSGPGAINLLSGIAGCYFDSSPAVFLTGQVNRHELRGERAIRQLGFQETDVVPMAAPVTKGAWQARGVAELPELVGRAFALASAPRRGPVLLDLPMDVQGAELDPPSSDAPVPPPFSVGPAPEPDRDAVDRVLRAVASAERPLALVGGGIRAAGAASKLRFLLETLQLPAVHSLMGVDVLPDAHPLRVGMIGTYGNRWANAALARSDCLIVLGSRLDIRQTGADTASFGARELHHVDCDAGEVNNRVTGCHPVVAELREFLTAASETAVPGEHRDWLDEIEGYRRRWPDTAELRELDGINPNELMHHLSGRSADATAFVADVGQHQMWAAQSLDLRAGQRFLTSGGLGAMGSGLPMAIGAAFARGGPVVLVVGDGGFQLNIQELQTIAHHRLPVKMVVLDNAGHGMVRQFQNTYFDGRRQSSEWGYSAPDFARVAAAYDIPAASVSEPWELNDGLAALWADPAAPALLNVQIDPAANAYPKIAFGRPLDQMEPDVAPVELGAG